MKPSVFVAVTGTKYYFGTEFIRPGQLIRFQKEPDNPHDQEAIKAEMAPIGKIGYVANSPQTVPKGCRSAGRIYDTFDEHLFGVVRFVVKDTIIVELVDHVEGICVVNVCWNEVTFGSISQANP